MSQSTLNVISQTQKEKLFYIDFKLHFLCAVNRNDPASRFGIKASAATLGISLYKGVAPKNLIYDTRAKSYTQTTNFKPVFKHKNHQALLPLCHRLGDNRCGIDNALITAEIPIQLNLNTLAAVTKTINQKKALKTGCLPLPNELSTRASPPFALVDNGLRRHARTYDRKRERFTDVVINHIVKSKILEGNIPTSQTKETYSQSSHLVEMHIVPHPNLKHPETIRAEYEMDKNLLKIETRAAVAGYILRKWNTVCSTKHTLPGIRFNTHPTPKSQVCPLYKSLTRKTRGQDLQNEVQS